MEYFLRTQTRDGRELLLRNTEASDAAAYLACYRTAHSETDFLTTYPDEGPRNADEVAGRLQASKDSERSAELFAFIGGEPAGSAGFSCVKDRDKTRHRASLGISVLKEFWGLGIGTALMKACIEEAKRAGYLQLELEAVSDNERALRLYESFGFTEYGRNPKAFRTREGRWQTLVYMRLEL